MASNPSGAPGIAPDGRRERWRVHREGRRRELVTAVVAAVQAEGPGVGMDDIAAHSGIAKQVFYRYFTDKADLQVAVGRALARSVVADITRAVDAETDLRAMLVAGISRYLELIETNGELYEFVVRSGAYRSDGPRDPGTDVVTDFQTVLGLQVARLIGDRLRAAGADAGAAEPWGFALVGAVRSAADRWLAAPSMTREALAAYLSEFVWQGLAAVDRPSVGGDHAGHGPEVESIVGRSTARRRSAR